jgi:hypothetical protein
MIYKGYVLTSELWRKCGVSYGLFRKENGFDIEKIGNYNMVKTETLPQKYKIIAQNACTDLGRYYPIREFERLLGLTPDHLSSMICQKLISLKTKKIYGARLVEVTDAFIEQMMKKKTPFYVSKKKQNAEFAEVIIDMYGIKIGFY